MGIMADSIQELQEKESTLKQMGGEKAIAKQHEQGKLTNLPGHVGEYESTQCPRCSYQLVRRSGYFIERYKITDEGKCPRCGEKIAGLWHSHNALSRQF